MECINVNKSFVAIFTEAPFSMSSDRDTMTKAVSQNSPVFFWVVTGCDMVVNKGNYYYVTLFFFLIQTLEDFKEKSLEQIPAVIFRNF